MHLATIRTIKIVSLTITSLEWVLVVMTVMVTFVVGGTPSEINLAKCQDPVASMSKTQMDVWTVPSLLMSDFSADTSFRFENQAQTCEDIVEFEIQIPQIQIDDASPAGTSHHIQIEIQNGNGWQEPSDNVTYFVSDTTELNQTIDHTNHAVDKPIATFTPTGHLFLDNEHYFRPSEYCIQSISSVTIGVKVCQPNCHSVKSLCIPICCTLGKVLYHNGTTETCVEIGGGDDNTTFEYRPTLYRDVNHKLSVEEGAQISQHFYKHMPRCAEGQVLTSYPFRRIHNILGSIVRVLSNGRVKLLLPLERKWKEFQNFCLAGLATSENGVEDNHNNADAEKPVSLRFSGSEEDQILYVCGDYASNEVGAPHFYIPVHFINSFFLFVTGLVYILLWEKQNIHGWTVLSFVLAMFFMFIFLAWSHLAAMLHKSNANPHFAPPPLVCRCVGALAHFFFLATFCWLAIINVDLWLTFKSMTPVSGRSKGVKRFICYMLFAWGTPAIIVGVGLVLTHVYPDPLSQVKVPGYGSVTCFLEPSVKGIYLYYNIGVLMGINLLFMGLTLSTIYNFKAGTRAVDAARSNNSQSLSAKLFFKLFVVMGVTHIFEFISWSQSVEETMLYWIVLDMFNILQSTGVFFIFVCKRKILNQLEQKYPSLKIITGPLKKLVVTGKATRTVTATTSAPDRTQMMAFSLRKFQTSSKRNAAETLAQSNKN